MVLLKNGILNYSAVLFCNLIFILYSFLSFSQTSELYSEEKNQERLRKHQELQQGHVDSLVYKKEQSIPDSSDAEYSKEYNNSLENDSSLPVFIDTGNPEHDHLDYRKRKDQWIKENPESYKKMHVSLPLTEEQKKEIELKKELRLNQE